jgi:hypothetical protein
MSAGALGFFLGCAPGVILAIRSGLMVQRFAARATDVAKEHGEYFDFRYPFSDRTNWFVRPAHFIRESDGPGVRKAKQMLLDVRRPFFRRHFQSIIVFFVGATLGTLISMGL